LPSIASSRTTIADVGWTNALSLFCAADGPKPSRKVLANLTALRKYAQETLDKIKAEEEAYDNAHQGIHNQSGKRD
jgi:hypothetical protein